MTEEYETNIKEINAKFQVCTRDRNGDAKVGRMNWDGKLAVLGMTLHCDLGIAKKKRDCT